RRAHGAASWITSVRCLLFTRCRFRCDTILFSRPVCPPLSSTRMAANGFRLHAQYLHHRGTLSAIENGQCRLAHAPAEDAPFLEVLGENQPKNRVVLIRRICRGG